MSKILNSESSLFLMVDIQERLVNAQFEKEKIIKNSAILAEAAQILGIPVLVSEQYPRGLGSTIPEIKEKLSEDAKFFEKTSFGCCGKEGFNELLKGYNRQQVIVCGMESHVCVHQTVYGLLELEYEVHIVQDAISSRKKAEYEQGINRMLYHGAVPSSLEMILFELLKGAKHPEFKSVQALVK